MRDEDALLPLRLKATERLLLVHPLKESLTMAEEDRYPTGFPVASIARRHPLVDAMPMTPRPTADEREQIVRRAAGADAVVIITMNANLFAEQAELVRRLVQPGQRVIGVAARNPYDLLAFPQLGTYLTTYEYTPPALEAAARALFGEIQPRGHLPVSLPGLYPRGHGSAFGRNAV